MNSGSAPQTTMSSTTMPTRSKPIVSWRSRAWAMATLVPTPAVLVASTGCAMRAIALASNMPAKPPSPPSTSGRVARRTLAFISSTALSPASTSTPASAYVMDVGRSVSLTPGSLPARSEGLEDVLDAVLGVAEEHLGVLTEEQRVLHAGVAGGHRAFEDDDVLGLPYPDDRHPGDGGGGVLGGGGVDGVVGADDEHDVDVLEVVVDLVHLEHDVVGHLGLGEQHVHVP